MLDDRHRLALAETRTAGKDHGPGQLIRYQLTNHLGSSVVELDQDAQVISYEEYYPYGSTSYQAVRASVETPKRYRYTGKERDAETGLYYYGSRYYIPWLARWSSCDPSGLADGPNLYCYVRANPVLRRDPTGRDGQDIVNPANQSGSQQPPSATPTAAQPGLVPRDKPSPPQQPNLTVTQSADQPDKLQTEITAQGMAIAPRAAARPAWPPAAAYGRGRAGVQAGKVRRAGASCSAPAAQAAAAPRAGPTGPTRTVSGALTASAAVKHDPDADTGKENDLNEKTVSVGGGGAVSVKRGCLGHGAEPDAIPHWHCHRRWRGCSEGAERGALHRRRQRDRYGDRPGKHCVRSWPAGAALGGGSASITYTTPDQRRSISIEGYGYRFSGTAQPGATGAAASVTGTRIGGGVAGSSVPDTKVPYGTIFGSA